MQRAMASVLSLVLNGCALHGAHVTSAPDSLHDWASVAAIPREAPIRVTVHYEIDGRLEDVTDSTLMIRVPPDKHLMKISRGLVIRVAELVPKKMRWGWLGKPLAVWALAGLVGALAGAVMTNATVAGISLAVFAGSSIGWFYHFVSHYADHEWRVVYVRP